MNTSTLISPEDRYSRSFIERRLSVETPDGVITPDVTEQLWTDKPYRPAAVLIPLVERDEGLTVLLTQRTDHLRNHAGQISFPGGRMEDHDATPVHTALRETHEEIGLTEDFITIAGRLDTYETGTGYQVAPIVGFVQPGFDLTLDTFEVAEVFEVPLSFVMDKRNHQRLVYKREGQSRRFYAMPYKDRHIWGATAGMLVRFSRLLHADLEHSSLNDDH